jgi:hypothetical protein
MIHYTERISALMRDIIVRVPRLSYIDPNEVLVFARCGRSGAAGAFATCHCLNLPPTEPGYYYWRDRASGRITRRSRWFVTKSPSLCLGGRPIAYLISFALPRFCDQSLTGSRKARYYDHAPAWLAKLDTIVHELYHIDPQEAGIRRVERSDGGAGAGSHGRTFLGSVADMVREYLASGPDGAVYDFLRYDFAGLNERYGGVLGTTFVTFPSFPQRFIELLPPAAQPRTPRAVRIQPLRTPLGPTRFTEFDLVVRQFLDRATCRVPRRDMRQAGSTRQMQLAPAAEPTCEARQLS